MDRETICELYGEDTIVLEPDFLDEAIVGASSDGILIYDVDLLANAFVKHDNMTYEEAIEWIEYNTIRALPYMGEKHPIVMYKNEE